jgi:hypothetical protein
MSLAQITYTGNGSNRNFAITFPYLESDDLSVTIDGDPVGFVLQTDGTLKTNPTPVDGASVVITRRTDVDERKVDFVDGGNITADLLDKDGNQAFYAIQELRDDVDFFFTTIQDLVVAAGDLPAVNPANINSALLSNAEGGWDVKTLAQTKAALGITALEDAISGEGGTGIIGVPDPETDFPGVLWTDGTEMKWEGIDDTRDLLNLGSIAVYDRTEFPLLIPDPPLETGTAIGNVLLVEDIGGEVAGLPAIDGSQLTGIAKAQYRRIEYRQNYNVDGGAYATGLTPQKIPFASDIVTNVNGGVALDTGDNEFTFAAGTYELNIRVRCRLDGTKYIRLQSGGSTILRGEPVFDESTDGDTWEPKPSVLSRFSAPQHGTTPEPSVPPTMKPLGVPSTTCLECLNHGNYRPKGYP